MAENTLSSQSLKSDRVGSKKERSGLFGRKVGMTQVFAEGGICIPVTVLEVGPCSVIEVKSAEKHGYEAVQVGFLPKKKQRLTKPLAGHFAKAGAGHFQKLGEIRCKAGDLGWNNVGHEIRLSDVFQEGQKVDVTATSKGRGFSGVVRRFGAKGQPATRGTHEYRRHIGAVGCRKFPGRIFKNKKMPGRMGGESVTVQNLEVVKIRPEDNLLLVRGAVPGANGDFVVVRLAAKAK